MLISLLGVSFFEDLEYSWSSLALQKIYFLGFVHVDYVYFGELAFVQVEKVEAHFAKRGVIVCKERAVENLLAFHLKI